jgi:hypothetical protein
MRANNEHQDEQLPSQEDIEREALQRLSKLGLLKEGSALEDKYKELISLERKEARKVLNQRGFAIPRFLKEMKK